MLVVLGIRIDPNPGSFLRHLAIEKESQEPHQFCCLIMFVNGSGSESFERDPDQFIFW